MITSIVNEKVKYLTKLMNSKKERDIEKLFIVEGEHLVEEAMNAQVVRELIISQDKFDHYVGIPKIYVTDEVMKKICDTITPQGIIALCEQSDITSFQTFDRLLILDDIQDPGNLGTIIRSCDAFNFDGIVMSQHTVDVYNPKVVRATQGAIFRVKMLRADIPSYIELLKSNEVLVYGTSLIGEELSQFSSNEKMAFILGNEGNGVKEELLRLTHNNLYIEMNGASESLNVAIAAAIIMYNFRKY